MSETIKRPEIKNVDFCVDENIWGHRLYDEQLPHLTVLESLTGQKSNQMSQVLFDAGKKPLPPRIGKGALYRDARTERFTD
jgi:hypothetical protein